MNETLKLKIEIDEDGWVSWEVYGDDIIGGSGNDPFDEFVELLREWKDDLNE